MRPEGLFRLRARNGQGDLRPGALRFEFEAESPEALLNQVAKSWGRYTTNTPRGYQLDTTKRVCRSMGLPFDEQAALGPASAFFDFLRRTQVAHYWRSKETTQPTHADLYSKRSYSRHG